MTLAEQVIANPLFRKLVRSVAVAEQPFKQRAKRYRLNSYTYGLWLSRGETWPGQGGKDRRARYFAAEIAKDVPPPWAFASQKETEAFVYITARDFVRAREMPK